MRVLNKTKFIRSMAVVLAASATIVVDANAQGCEVKVGLVGPLSGGAAIWGLSARNGAEIAAAEVNEKGGLQVGNAKCKVVIVTYDSKYSAEGAAAAANSMASQGIGLILGPMGSPEVTGIKPVAERNRQVTVNISYAKDAIGPQWPLAFHGVTGPGSWAKPLARIATDRFGIKSVVVVAPNDQGGTDVASVNAAAYQELGVKTVEEYYQRGTTNFAPLIARIMRVNPEAVDTASSPPGDAATMVKQLLEAGFKGVFGRLGGVATEEIIRGAGGIEALGNLYWLEGVVIPPEHVEAILARQKALGQSPLGNMPIVAVFAATGRIALNAISAAGTSSDGTKIAEELRKQAVDDRWLGKGDWTGMSAYGIRQELGFPAGIGLIVKGKNLGVTTVSVSGR